MIFKQSSDIASPLASLYYEFYSDYSELKNEIANREDEIQCIVGRDYIEFGKAQQPELWEYADGVDSMAFLTSL